MGILHSKKTNMDEPRSEIALSATPLEIPEILAIVLESLDTERLKLFRRVCLTWSNEISRILCARVVPRYSNSDWTKFQTLLDKGTKLPRLLCPFQEMYARVCKEELNPYKKRSFDWLRPPFPITRLTLLFTTGHGDQAEHFMPFKFEEFMQKMSEGTPFPPVYDPDLQKCVWILLQSCSGTLTHLATPCWILKKEQELELGLASLHFPQLTALKAVKLKCHPFIYPLWEEMDFFLRIFAAAPKLKVLELEDIPSVELLLPRASLKGLAKLIASECYVTWGTLNSVNSEALKLIRTAGFYDGVGEDSAFVRFSPYLEYGGVVHGSYDLPACPFLTHLEFHTQKPRIDANSFPSLKRVTLHGEWAPQITPSCLTVTEVDIEGILVDESSRRIRLLEELFQLFPCASFWKVNYQTLEDFCQVVSREQFFVEKLALSLRCFGEKPCIRNCSNGKATAAIDKKTFSGFHLLQNLLELELHQSPTKHRCKGRRAEKLPYNVSKIQYDTLPKLRTLRIFANSDELPQDLIALEHLDIAVEVIVDPRPTFPNWSKSLLPMGNVTLRVEKAEFP